MGPPHLVSSREEWHAECPMQENCSCRTARRPREKRGTRPSRQSPVTTLRPDPACRQHISCEQPPHAVGPLMKALVRSSWVICGYAQEGVLAVTTGVSPVEWADTDAGRDGVLPAQPLPQWWKRRRTGSGVGGAGSVCLEKGGVGDGRRAAGGQAGSVILSFRHLCFPVGRSGLLFCLSFNSVFCQQHMDHLLRKTLQQE